MKNYFAIILLSFLTILSSCTEVQKETSTQQLIDEIDEAKLRASEQDDQITFWKDMLNQERYASDRVARASINYNIARNFAPLSIDSAEIYITKALILIEDVEGFENEKTAIYNGLGNIATSKGKTFLSSFYYHKTVSILNANPSVSTIPTTNKIQFYLHSAQSNSQIGLYETAYDLNKKAEKHLFTASQEDYLWFRVYSQLFFSGINTSVTADSLKIYLEKVGNYSNTEEDLRFFHEYKADFFSIQGQFDSAKLFYEKVVAFHKNKDLEKSNNSNAIHISDTYISYCHLLENSIDRKEVQEASAIIGQMREIEKKYPHYLNSTDSLPFLYAIKNYYYLTKDLTNYAKATEKLLELKDQIQKDAELQAKKEMETMYQLEENKKSIKELNQSVEITESQLQKTKYFLAITILAILIILAILAILYYRQKSRKLQQEYEKIILEQKLLRTQMEPHFIFNTLSTLQSLIRFQEPKKAIDYLNKFSRLLRSNLELSRQEMISLEDEVETIHNYLSLQQARFVDYFTYQIQVPNELEIDALFIPPMLIQPFVENSILHGFDGEKEWHIDIKITELVATKQLQIEIIDNGVGINTLTKKKHKSLSGDIAKERLEILSKKYKIPTDYQIFSEQGKGTTVCLKLPIIDGFQQN